MDVLLDFNDELVPQNPNVCGGEVRQNNFIDVPHGLFNLSESAFLFSQMSHGTCLVTFGMAFTLIRTT